VTPTNTAGLTRLSNELADDSDPAIGDQVAQRTAPTPDSRPPSSPPDRPHYPEGPESFVAPGFSVAANQKTETREGMPAPTAEHRPTRRGGRGSGGTNVARALDLELEAAQRMAAVLGSGGLMAEYHEALTATRSAWSRYTSIGHQMRAAALDVGMTAEQWEALRQGRTRVR
jgi:hypothetical protein